jgi:hypothetical protein
MRYINIMKIKLPCGWTEKAQQALEDIKEKPQTERIEAINQKSGIWGDLKENLKKCSHNKCWYCESRISRSDWPVDHFRPKGRVYECKDHDGYWWLAFELKNYRFSCTYCNSHRIDRIAGSSGGKQDHFPLLSEKNRARNPQDDIEAERPCLLDPTKIIDPGLLWFDQSGEVVPKYSKDQYLILHKRAEVSIIMYHLNYHETSEKRKILYNEVAMLVRDGNKYFNLLAKGNHDKEYELQRVLDRLYEMLDESAEYSAATRSYLNGLKSNESEWLDSFITSCLS